MRLPVVLLLVPVWCLAQTPAAPPPPAAVGTVEDARVGRPEQPASFDLAQRLLMGGQAEQAIPILEDLVAAQPENLPIWLRLTEAYAAARRYAEAVALIDARESREGRSAYWSSERGRLLAEAGLQDEALAAWEDAIAAEPETEQTYRLVASALASARRYDEAIGVYERGRERLGRPTLFDIERATLYGLALRYGEAADLYLSIVSREPRALPAVRNQLVRMMGGEGAAEAFAASADRALARDPTSLPVRSLVGWLALERGDYRTALDATRALDRLEQQQGQGLLEFARAAEGAGALDEANAALDEALQRYPEGPAALDATLARAALADRRAREAGEHVGRGPTPFADAAREDYRAAMALTHEAPPHTLALAHLLRDVYADYDAATVLLQSVATGPDAASAASAGLALGDVAVRAGDLDAAREHFTTVESAHRLGPAAEQARFELALLDFYEGLVYSALARVEAMDDNTAADVSNDAISLRVTLQENITEVGPDTTSDGLRQYARAALLHRQGHDADALARLDSLAAALTGHPIQDELLFLSAQTLRALERPADAVNALERLASIDPTSFFRDRSLVLQAEIFEMDLDDRASAADRYDRLLIDFPASLFAPEARLRLRRLRSPS